MRQRLATSSFLTLSTKRDTVSHYPSCENAKHHACFCSQCSGTLHAWPSRLELALKTPEERDAFRDAINEAWTHNDSKRRPGFPPSKKLLAAGIDSAVIDIVDFMAEHPTSIIMDVQQAGDLLPSAAKKGPSEKSDRRKLAEHHFWCELLVQIALTLKEANHLTQDVPPRIIASIFSPQNESGANLLGYRRLLEPAIRKLWTDFVTLPYITHSAQAILATRILAIIICPAPEEHQSVRDHCLRPLSSDAISDITKARLQQLFPEDWTGKLYRNLAS